MRFLIYRDSDRCFVDVKTTERLPAGNAYPDDMIAVEYGGEVVLPLWLVPNDALTDEILDRYEENWSVRLARCRTVGELAEVTDTLDAAQAQELFQTLPDELLHAWTGRPFRRGISRILYELALERFERRLGEQGASVESIPVTDGQPLSLRNVEPINRRPPKKDGRRVCVDALRIPDGLRIGLRQQGISALYTHQALALEYIREMGEGRFDLVLTTPTASGKTWAFLPGIVEDLMKRGGGALFLYPLRALTIDQHDKIKTLLQATPEHELRLDHFYGDRSLRDVVHAGLPNLLVATPDKLNHYLHERGLQSLIKTLRYIVLDEAHTYRGFFGINAALFLRRLLYFAQDGVRLILSSATLENTIDFARRLTGRTRFRVIGASGAPGHPRYYYLSQNRYRSDRGGDHLIPLRDLGRSLASNNRKTVVFVPRRAQAQRMSQTLRIPDLQVSPIVSGASNYTQILEQLRSGERATLVFSTSTLEAGIDIGDLDYVGIHGFPGSRTSFKQMAGRAGRRGPGHIVFFQGSTPADAYYGVPENLRQLVDDDADPVYIDPTNVFVLKDHLRRLCWEASRATGPPKPEEVVDALLPPAGFSDQEARHRLFEHLLPIARTAMKEKDRRPGAPQLRGVSGVQYLIVRTGGPDDPPFGRHTIDLSTETKLEWLVESTTDLVAYREWALESVVLREVLGKETYYRVLAWTQGRVLTPWRQEAVFIWVEDVTDDLLPPEEYVRQGTPPQRAVQHFHQVSLSVTTELTRTIGTQELGPFRLESGAGEVASRLPSHRSVWSKGITFTCPRTKDSAGGKAYADDGLPWEVVDVTSGRHLMTVNPTDTDREAWCKNIVLPKGAADERYPLMYRVVEREPGADRVRVLVEKHAFDRQAGGRCSCGEVLEAEHHWTVDRESMPVSWSTHHVFSLVPRTLKTVLTKITLRSASGGAAFAFFNALVKALPHVLEIEPDDIGYMVDFEDGVACLTVYDSIEGGLGISTRIPEALPDIFAEVHRLLRMSMKCTCQGKGCFGCILPFRSLRISAEIEAEIEKAYELLEELEPFRTRLSVAAANAFVEATASQIGATASTASASKGSEPFFRDLLFDLDGVLLDTPYIEDDSRRRGQRVYRRTDSQPYPGVERMLERVCSLPDLRVAVVTNAPAQCAEDLIRHHFPDAAERLLENLIAAAGKPNPAKTRSLLEGQDPARALLIGARTEDLSVARRLGIPSALALWGCADAASVANAGPDLLLDKPADLSELITDPQRWQQPLEAEGLEVNLRRPPLQIRREGCLWTVFSRYMPAKRTSSNTLLGMTGQRALWFKLTGAGALPVAEYIAFHFPGIPVVVIPERPGHETQGLPALIKALREIGHPAIDGLQWNRVPEKRQKEAGETVARRENVRDAFAVRDPSVRGKRVLLVDDVVTTGATLAEAARALTASGAEVIPVAIAYTVFDEDRGETFN